jgi:hypothetical protein
LLIVGIKVYIILEINHVHPRVNVVVVRLMEVKLLLDINGCTFPSNYSNSGKGTSKKKKAYHTVRKVGLAI